MGWGSNLLIKKGKDVIACLNSSDQVALFKINTKYSHICNLQLRKNDYLCRTEFFISLNFRFKIYRKIIYR